MKYICTLQNATLVWATSEVQKSYLPLFCERVVMTHEIAACCLFM